MKLQYKFKKWHLILLLLFLFLGLLTLYGNLPRGEEHTVDIKDANFINYDIKMNAVHYEKNGQQGGVLLFGIHVNHKNIMITDGEYAAKLISPIPPDVWIDYILKDKKLEIEFQSDKTLWGLNGGYVFFYNENGERIFLQEYLTKLGISEAFNMGVKDDYKARIREAYQYAREHQLGIHMKTKGDVPQSPSYDAYVKNGG